MKKIFSPGYTDHAISIATFILRLGAATPMMIIHGLDKLKTFSEKSGHFADPFHVGASNSLALVVFAEFFCAALVLLGFLTRLACIPLIINMAVALFMIHKSDFLGKGELAGVYLACFVALLFTGPGKISIDKLISKGK